ncbi:type I-MYXAN CRISPR-associated protein Cas5/Cmx5/DevS [bacterium]|nr:type I-MYXAN CRISPR-associated protein Cas5/Cmx5/DevS [bacterium]MCI0604157.1 type I-MYXAN CRISPR-associated protein Cas5/Cmx5/DevS [bacterium]
MEQIGLYVSVPITSFRVPRAREYFETFPCPPPSTVYGMLLSIVGEENRYKHEGTEIAIALVCDPEYSVVLRTVWRVKEMKNGPGLGNNRRPDFQEILSPVEVVVWVRKGQDEVAETSLLSRLAYVMEDPQRIKRFGGVSLGESTHLVNDVCHLKYRSDQKDSSEKCHLLVSDQGGDLALPIWPDHVGSTTSWGQFKLLNTKLPEKPSSRAWIPIKR